MTPEELDRRAAERAAQGLPTTIEDPVALAHIAALVRSAEPGGADDAAA